MEAEYANYVSETAALDLWRIWAAILSFVGAFLLCAVVGACVALAKKEAVHLWAALGIGVILAILSPLVPIGRADIKRASLEVQYADAIAWAHVNRGITFKESE